MTALRSRGRPRKASKIQIVENAMALYWHDGLSSRSLNEMCRQLEVSKPGLYREFGGEDGLIAECLTRSTGRQPTKRSGLLSKMTNHFSFN